MRSSPLPQSRLWSRLSGWARRVIEDAPRNFDRLAPETSRWLPPF
jgi:hypothetical protein